MKAKLFFSFLFLYFANLSFSQTDEDFILAASAKDGSEYYVYIEKVNYDSKDIWVKNPIPVKSVKNKKGKLIKSGGGYTLAFMKVNCSDREYDLIQTIAYDKNGNVKENYENDSYGNKVIPGSIMSGIFEYVCTE